MRGTLPSIPRYDIQVSDYSEEFTLTKPGLVTSSSSRSFSLKGTGQKVKFDVTHTIEFVGGCEDKNKRVTSRFKSARNYIVYDDSEQVLR